MIDRETIIHLLDEIDRAATRRDVRVELFIVGGGAMALAYNATRVTGDLDAVFEPTSVVRAIAREVAETFPELNLADDWLNDAVKGFLPGADENASVLFDRPNLAVTIASPRYLFVLKAMAAREVDEGDLRALWPLCGFEDAAEALDVVEAAYPRIPIRPAVQYLIEAIGAEEGDHSDV